MSTINKLTPVAIAIDSQGEKLIKAMSKKGEEGKGATQKAVDYLFSAMGWRTETIKAGIKVNDERREQLRALIVAGFSQEKQHLINLSGDALNALTEEGKKDRKKYQQSIGPYIRLVEKGIEALEEKAKPKEEVEAEKKEAKEKNTEFAKIQAKLQTVLDLLLGMEKAPDGVDIPKAVERVKALKGGLPSI